MSITPAKVNETSPEDFFSATPIASPDIASLDFPSYFGALTYFSPRPSPHHLRRNHATALSFNPQISLLPSTSRVV
jgi:hypothetical protein